MVTQGRTQGLQECPQGGPPGGKPTDIPEILVFASSNLVIASFFWLAVRWRRGACAALGCRAIAFGARRR